MPKQIALLTSVPGILAPIASMLNETASAVNAISLMEITPSTAGQVIDGDSKMKLQINATGGGSVGGLESTEAYAGVNGLVRRVRIAMEVLDDNDDEEGSG